MEDLFLQEEIIFLRKELVKKQRIIEMLQQQLSENIKPIQRVENTSFNNDVDVTYERKLIKDCVKNANIRFSKEKNSKYQLSCKLINDGNMEKFALITEKINIQLDDIRNESRKRFNESKGKKMEKVFLLKLNTQSLKIKDQVQ